MSVLILNSLYLQNRRRRSRKIANKKKKKVRRSEAEWRR